MAKRVTHPKATPERRSPCPVACALDVFGDRWTLLVLRDLVLGKTRFKDFAASPEGIPTNVLSERLARLLAQGMVTQVSVGDGAKHPAYRLTDKGRAVLPVLQSIRDWGLAWEKGTQVLLDEAAPVS
ncbi:MAG: helix-turn-helix domain-containing protein [Verrucomicrobia bacterium]|nr:helix-turn-helix domain-containing protein [Verrucomicrobiota bacterium]